MAGDDDIRTVAASNPAVFQDALRFWADRAPDAPAFFTQAGSPIAFSELLPLLDGIGMALNDRGFGRGDRIAVVHPGGLDCAMAILGIWSYATVIPLSPKYRLGEYAVYLRDLRIDAVAIAQGWETPARTAAERLGIPVLDLVQPDAEETGRIRLDGARIERPHETGLARPDDIAVALMTSGTTSESKIVPVRHGLICPRAEDSGRLLGYTRRDRGASMMQLHHWGGFGAMTYTLFAGSSVAHFPGQDIGHTFRCLETLKPTYLSGPYTVFHAILAQRERLAPSIEKIRPGLRMLRTGSGHLDLRVAGELEEIFGVPVIQAYGSSETAFMTCQPLPPAPRKPGSVGLPGSAIVAVLDEDGRPLPPNTVGAVGVKGPKVFDGYENNPEANAEAFIDGWFRVGDLGYFDDEGHLFLTGRIKEIINRGGAKITPGEIDAAIMAHPAVATAAAFPVPHPTLGDDVAAAVVLQPGATLDHEALTRTLRDTLSAEKLPRRILFVDAIPKGKTGKIQRYKLAAAFGLDGSARPAGKGSAAATPTEKTLQRIWSETLQLADVPVDADFFALGGDSMLAVELFLRIEEELGRRLPRAALFEASTVREMAQHIETGPSARCLVPIQPNGDQPPLFCVHDINGQVLNFRTMAQELGPDQPVYGLQLAGLDGTEMPLGRVEDMAARYLSEIRAAGFAGPYRLCGYSMGGLVAYEMAQQLRAADETVDLLALLDTFPRPGLRRSTLTEWFTQGGNVLNGKGPASIARFLGKGARNIAQNARTASARRSFGTAWRFCERSMATVPRWLHRPAAANLLASRTYRARRYDGDVVLFKAEPYRNDRLELRDSWRNLIGGRIEVLPVPGLHHEILDAPHVHALARLLSECLEDRTRQIAGESESAAAD